MNQRKGNQTKNQPLPPAPPQTNKTHNREPDTKLPTKLTVSYSLLLHIAPLIGTINYQRMRIVLDLIGLDSSARFTTLESATSHVGHADLIPAG